MLIVEWRCLEPTRSHYRVDSRVGAAGGHAGDEFVDGGTVVDEDVEERGEVGPFGGLMFGVVAAYVQDSWL